MFVEFILALLPIIWLFIAFLVLKMPGYIGCLIALAISIVESLVIPAFSLTVPEALTAAIEGGIGAIWPICLIILAAMFTYNICVKTGAMEMIKRLLTSVTNDKRVLVMLLTWGFGGFMEAIAGFGTPVAIPAAMMVGLGFDPIFSAVVCLVANSLHRHSVPLPFLQHPQPALLVLMQLFYRVLPSTCWLFRPLSFHSSSYG